MAKEFFDKQRCDRCLGPLQVRTMSRFNTDTICMVCVERERRHPRYAEAEAYELAAVRRGELNCLGLGCPADLYIPSTFIVGDLVVPIWGIRLGWPKGPRRVTKIDYQGIVLMSSNAYGPGGRMYGISVEGYNNLIFPAQSFILAPLGEEVYL